MSEFNKTAYINITSFSGVSHDAEHYYASVGGEDVWYPLNKFQANKLNMKDPTGRRLVEGQESTRFFTESHALEYAIKACRRDKKFTHAKVSMCDGFEFLVDFERNGELIFNLKKELKELKEKLGQNYKKNQEVLTSG